LFEDYSNAEDWAIAKGCTKLDIHYAEDFHTALSELIISTLREKGTIE
jgi:hypothetical protein